MRGLIIIIIFFYNSRRSLKPPTNTATSSAAEESPVDTGATTTGHFRSPRSHRWRSAANQTPPFAQHRQQGERIFSRQSAERCANGHHLHRPGASGREIPILAWKPIGWLQRRGSDFGESPKAECFILNRIRSFSFVLRINNLLHSSFFVSLALSHAGL